MASVASSWRWAALALLAVAAIAACAGPPPAAPAAVDTASAPARTKMTIGVGGLELFVYLPLTLTRQLGYFEQAGLDVEIVNFQGGGKALEALIGGGIDAVSGFYDHTIQSEPKGLSVRMVVVYDRFPGIVLLADSDLTPRVQTV